MVIWIEAHLFLFSFFYALGQLLNAISIYWVSGVCLPPTSWCSHCRVIWGVYSEVGIHRGGTRTEDANSELETWLTSPQKAFLRIPAQWDNTVNFHLEYGSMHIVHLFLYFVLDFRIYLLTIKSTKNNKHLLDTDTILSSLNVLAYLILTRTLSTKQILLFALFYR